MARVERDPWGGVGRSPEDQRRRVPNYEVPASELAGDVVVAGAEVGVSEDPWFANIYYVGEFEVRYLEPGWKCECDSEKKVCAHVLAVIKWRREHGSMAVGGAELATSLTPADSEVTPPTAIVRSTAGRRDQAQASGWTSTVAPTGGGQNPGRSPETKSPPNPAVVETEAPHPDAPLPTDECLTPARWSPLPAWVTQIRPHQWDAAVEVVEALERGVGLVFVDAPTGSGKTLLGDLIARMLQQPAIYLCTTKGLQDQVVADYPYAKVLKGKANYRTMHKPFPEFSADDCDGQIDKDNCSYCQPMHACAYRRAKSEAIRSQLAVINMAYWLREANLVRQPAFSLPPDPSAEPNTTNRRRQEGGLFIIDECDTLENQLLGFIEFSLSKTRVRELRVTPPKKGVHKPTIAKWMLEELVPALEERAKLFKDDPSPEGKKHLRGLEMMVEDVHRIVPEIGDDNWLRDYSDEYTPFSMKPTRIEGYGPDMIWRHGGRFVLMSATIISPEEMVETLGYEGEYAVVRVPMTFPVENRQVHIAPVADMVYKDGAEERDFPKLVAAIEGILRRHPTDRVLIHTVSYFRAKKLMRELRDVRRDRRVLTYANAREREEMLEVFRATPGSVLVAPSFERGVDLKDDDCRVQIVAKMPYPNISDPRVNARAHGPGGEAWMAVQTIRSLVQMTGRAVRSADDWCVTYVLDRQFVSRVWRQNKNLLPVWWRESVNMQFRTKDLLNS